MRERSLFHFLFVFPPSQVHTGSANEALGSVGVLDTSVSSALGHMLFEKYSPLQSVYGRPVERGRLCDRRLWTSSLSRACDPFTTNAKHNARGKHKSPHRKIVLFRQVNVAVNAIQWLPNGVVSCRCLLVVYNDLQYDAISEERVICFVYFAPDLVLLLNPSGLKYLRRKVIAYQKKKVKTKADRWFRKTLSLMVAGWHYLDRRQQRMRSSTTAKRWE